MAGLPPRVGVLLPSVNTVLEQELPSVAAATATFHFHRLDLEVGSDRDALEAMAASAPGAAALLAHLKPSALLYGCTSGSLIGGRALDERLADALTAVVRVPVILTAASVAAALQSLHVKRVAVGTPYLSWLSGRTCDYMRSHGLDVVAVRSLGLVDGLDMAALSPEEVGDLTRSVDRDNAEAIFLSCTDLPTFGVIESLEQELGKPVVSSNSASWWALTVALDIAGPISGPGRLFRTTEGRICQ
jgi:maleate isomerase